MKTETYFDKQKQKNILLLRELIFDLPDFCAEFFRSRSQTTSLKTRVAYAYDLKIFFNYLLKYHRPFKNKTIDTLTLLEIDKIQSEDIDLFMEYLTLYEKPDPENPDKTVIYQNDEKGKARKLAAIRSMYKYFYKKKKISANPAEIVETPKIHDKAIIRLEANELADLLDEVESGENLSGRQKAFHERNKIRDLAIISMLAGTGMRVSECVGIDIKDIDFDKNGIKITRKGGNQSIIYFGDEVRDALIDYINNREKITAEKGHEDALFLSSHNKRISVRAVQNLVKKYSKVSVKLKNISPHKLRSTFGTNLYQETGDIYIVAETLGHSDVNTTRKHYAQIEDEKRRAAVKHIKLRKD